MSDPKKEAERAWDKVSDEASRFEDKVKAEGRRFESSVRNEAGRAYDALPGDVRKVADAAWDLTRFSLGMSAESASTLVKTGQDVKKAVYQAFVPDIPKMAAPGQQQKAGVDPAMKLWMEQARRNAATGGSQKSTVMTSPLGVLTPPITTNKTLLGQ